MQRDSKQEALENTAAKSISLQDYLLGPVVDYGVRRFAYGGLWKYDL